MKWLRNKLRAWLGVTEADAPAASKALGVSPNMLRLSESERIALYGTANLVARSVAMPTLPPLVRGSFVYNEKDDPGLLGAPLAMDDAQNAPMWAYMNQNNCGLGFQGYPYLAELAQRSEYRAPVETIAAEATREWIDITVRGKASKKKRDEEESAAVANDEDADGNGTDDALEDRIEDIEQALEQFNVRDIFRRISEQDGFFGRSQLYLDIDAGKGDRDERDQLPLIVDPKTIKKGSLRGLQAVEPIWTSPYNYNSTDPTLPSFYKPNAWFVMGRRVHASRLLTFVSREVPDMLKPAYNFGGISMTQLMEPFVFQWLRTRNSVSDLINSFSIIVLKTDMAAVLAADPGASAGFFDRLKLFTQTRANQGIQAIDMKREELEQLAVPLSGLDKLQAQAQEHMAAPSHIPLVKLTGITPSGLNASSEGEIKVWYDWIRSYQIAFFSKHLKHVLDVIQLHLFGDIDDSIGFEFRPLSSPTVKELAEIRKANAEAGATLIDKGVIAPEEERERVSSDPESGYNNLTGPAPTPPTMVEAEHGAAIGEEGKEADAQRAAVTAEEDHKRALELEKTKKKAA